jgi:hypothetical protein
MEDCHEKTCVYVVVLVVRGWGRVMTMSVATEETRARDEIDRPPSFFLLTPAPFSRFLILSD